ncbi:MAG: MBL fold metallo-hydrolase [Erysipelotrichaceae bacterium]|jgi:metallo-beta-lactamase class B|nr:MBL fold metallo-hydrolase [Erysipelotrichaceae bacterium]
MINELFTAITPEEAATFSHRKPFLPYQPNPVISKLPKNGTLQPIEPLKVFDNVYWMGSRAVGVLVIDTGEGFVMIDSGSNDTEAAHIAGSFARMDLNAADIRLIVISHEHFDHYGGVPYFLREVCPDAMVAISRTGWNLLQTVPTEFAFTQPRPQKADILMDDGLCMKVGNTRLLCISTPGHSAGCMSFIFNSSFHGEDLSVGVMGGSAVWPNFPEARLYENSIEYFKLYTDSAGCNAFSAVHQNEAELNKVRDHWNKGTEHPWVCRKEEFDSACLQEFRNKAQNTIYSGRMQPYMMPNGTEEGSPLPPRK